MLTTSLFCQLSPYKKFKPPASADLELLQKVREGQLNLASSSPPRNVLHNRQNVRRKTLVSYNLKASECNLRSNAIYREQDKEATVYIGNIDERVTDSLVWELMLQAGRIVNVHLPKDRVTQSHQGYGFVEFISEEDAEYAARVMNQVRLYGKPIRVNKVSVSLPIR